MEQCIGACFRLCPDAERPPQFRTGYQSLLHELDRQGDVKTLGRHLAIFVAAYPRETASVRELTAKHAKAGDEVGEGYAALLRLIDSDTPLSHQQGVAPHGNGLGALVEPELLAEAATWWQPPASPTEGDSDSVEASKGHGATVLLGALFGIAGALVAVVILPVLTLKRGLLVFRWYALGAVWIGATVGFLCGAYGEGAGHHSSASAHHTNSPQVVTLPSVKEL